MKMEASYGVMSIMGEIFGALFVLVLIGAVLNFINGGWRSLFKKSDSKFIDKKKESVKINLKRYYDTEFEVDSDNPTFISFKKTISLVGFWQEVETSNKYADFEKIAIGNAIKELLEELEKEREELTLNN